MHPRLYPPMVAVLACLLVALGLAACSPPATPAPPDTAAPTVAPTNTPQPSPTPPPTDTPEPTATPTETPIPTDTPTITPTPTPTVVAVSAANAAEVKQLLTWKVPRQSVLQWAPDGTLFAGDYAFYDIATGEEVGRLDLDYSFCAGNVRFSPTEPVIVALLNLKIGNQGGCGEAVVISRETGEILARRRVPGENTWSNGGLTLAPDGRSALIGWFQYGTNPLYTLLERWDFENTPLAVGSYPRATYSPDGKLIAGIGGGQNSVEMKVFDAATGAEVARLYHAQFDGRGNYGAILFSPDGKEVIASAPAYPGARTTPIQVWDIATGEVVREIGRQGMLLTAVSPDGSVLVAQDIRKGDLYLYAYATGELLATLKHPGGFDSGGYAYGPGLFSPDGSLLINTAGNQVTVWGLEP